MYVKFPHVKMLVFSIEISISKGTFETILKFSNHGEVPFLLVGLSPQAFVSEFTLRPSSLRLTVERVSYKSILTIL